LAPAWCQDKIDEMDEMENQRRGGWVLLGMVGVAKDPESAGSDHGDQLVVIERKLVHGIAELLDVSAGPFRTGF
jgi:hypothetical protein